MKLERIVINMFGGIGDAVLLTPIFLALKKRFPQSHLTFLARYSQVEAVKELCFIDEVIAANDYVLHKTEKLNEMAKKIRGYDAIFVFEGSESIPKAAAWAEIPIRLGIGDTYARRRWLTHKIEWEEHMSCLYWPYLWSYILKNTINIDIPYSELDQVYFPEPLFEDYNNTESMLEEKGYSLKKPFFACSPTTNSHLRDWPKENWCRLLKKTYEYFKIPAILFGVGEMKYFDNIPGIINLCGKTTLKQIACIIKQATLVVNSNSLPAHMADAFNVPSIIFYGYTSKEIWMPRKNCVAITANLNCSPCHTIPGHGNSRNCLEAKCMNTISVESVFKEIEKYLSFS